MQLNIITCKSLDILLLNIIKMELERKFLQMIGKIDYHFVIVATYLDHHDLSIAVHVMFV
jgi:hypothetical protein